MKVDRLVQKVTLLGACMIAGHQNTLTMMRYVLHIMITRYNRGCIGMGIRKGAICTGGRSKGDSPFEVALPHLLSLVPRALLAWQCRGVWRARWPARVGY